MQFFSEDETITINGKSVKRIYGGFGDGQPAILAKQIAELHGYEPGEINRIINNHRDWFDDGIDIIDLAMEIKHSQHIFDFLLNFYSRDALNASKYIFILSQQGYALLIKFLESELAKKFYKLMVRDYFGIKFVTQKGFARQRDADVFGHRTYNALNHMSEDDNALELMLRKRTKMLEMFGFDKSRAVIQAAESIRQDTGIDVIERLKIRVGNEFQNSDSPEDRKKDTKPVSDSIVTKQIHKKDTKPVSDSVVITKQIRNKDTKSVPSSRVPKIYRGWSLIRRGKNKDGEDVFNLVRKIGNKRVQKYLGVWNQEKADQIIDKMNQKHNENN